ncbi:MAG: GntR family transcriptional regulator [Thalassobaculales bacterium]
MGLSADVKAAIREDIVSGALPFGGRLRIDALAARYGASHMPIREALRELAGEGLVVLVANRGARTRAIDRDFVRSLFEMRQAVEVMLTRRAAERLDAAALDGLRAIEAEREGHAAAGAFDAAVKANARFHQAIYAAAGNAEALALADRHWLLLAALWRRVGHSPGRFAGVANDHAHILQALASRDAEAAGVLMAAHVTKARQALEESLGAGFPG